MRFISLLVLLTTTTTVVLSEQTVFDFKDWSKNDLVEYLIDHSPLNFHTDTNNFQYSLKYLSSKSIEDLRKDAESYWNQYNDVLDTKKKQWWNFWSNKLKNFNPTDFLPMVSSNNNCSVSDWLFETWSKDTLTHFLKSNGIDITDIQYSKDKLINQIRQHFDTISTKMDRSGLYPSKDFFKDWSKNDLCLWLDKFKIPYDKQNINKCQLLNLVRQNIYQMSHFLENERASLLTDLKLFTKQLYDKEGNLKSNVFDSWNTHDLEKWLQSHEIPIQENLIDSHGYLVQLANQNRDLLLDDINWYLSVQKKDLLNTHPFLKKTPEYVSSLWNVSKSYLQSLYESGKNKSDDFINDTFLIGIDNWPQDKLKKFLDLRDVKYSYFVTRQELIDLVFENRNKPLKKLIKDWQKTFDTLNKDVKDWSLEKKNDLLKSETYENLLNNLAVLNQQRKDWQQSMKENLESWSMDDLTEYIKQFGIKLDEKMYSKDELIEIAKDNTQWFLGVPKNQPTYKKVYDKFTNICKRLKNYVLYNRN